MCPWITIGCVCARAHMRVSLDYHRPARRIDRDCPFRDVPIRTARLRVKLNAVEGEECGHLSIVLIPRIGDRVLIQSLHRDALIAV